MNYRSDIDGLRAIAVLAVVLYHFDIDMFSGGYVGVDVFFVISGYLITSILLESQEEQNFSLTDFYERRIRRILPALYLVVFCSFFAALFLFLPRQLTDFSCSALATSVFVSNVLFWRQQSVYFADPVILKPLLHTWSLAIEEQFYLLFPLFLCLTFKFCRKAWPAFLAVLGVTSFALSEWGVRQAPVAAFYLAPARAWELIIGAMLASNMVPATKNKFALEICAVSGLVMILWSIFAFSDLTAFPGINALVPCFGCALLIYAGQGEGSAKASQLLRLRGLVFVGLISYSLYLWHWPIIVFTKYWAIVEPTPLLKFVMVLCSFVFATISWRFVELPFRRRLLFPSQKAIFCVAGATTAFVMTLGAIGFLSQGVPQRMSDDLLAAADQKIYLHDRTDCHGVWRKNSDAICVRGAPNAVPDFVLLGDSHADAASPAVFRAAEMVGRSGYHFTNGGYRPTVGFAVRGSQKVHRELHESVRAILKNPNIKEVYLLGYWADAMRKLNVKLDGTNSLVTGKFALSHGLKRLVAEHPDIRFAILEDNPVGEILSPEHFVRARYLRRPYPDGLERAAYNKQTETVRTVLDNIAEAPNVYVVEMADHLCNNQLCPSVNQDGPIYRNRDHLSAKGALLLTGLFEELLNASFADALKW